MGLLSIHMKLCWGLQSVTILCSKLSLLLHLDSKIVNWCVALPPKDSHIGFSQGIGSVRKHGYIPSVCGKESCFHCGLFDL